MSNKILQICQVRASSMSIDDIKFAICRGGWPASLREKADNAKLAIAKDLFSQTCSVDRSKIDNVKRNVVDPSIAAGALGISPEYFSSEYKTLGFWEIGKEIEFQQREKGWGKSIVEVLSKDLQKEFPGVTGFSARNLWLMRSFYIEYSQHIKLQLPVAELTREQTHLILPPLVAEISWTKNIPVILWIHIE